MLLRVGLHGDFGVASGAFEIKPENFDA